jgi:hypothetical protein
LAVAGCDGGGSARGPDGGGRTVQPVPEDGVVVRYKFAKDQLVRYELEFRANSEGTGTVSDTVRSAVYQTCLGPTAESPSFQKLNIVRREIERLKKESDAKGRDLPVVTATRAVEPDISPNYGYDKANSRSYYPFDERGILGRTAENPYHRVWYDSLVYMLPVLPPGKVLAGRTWAISIPVYVGADYFYPMGGYLRGNEFELSFSGKVDRVHQRGGETLVQLSWTCAGAFDTQASPDRFPPAFHTRQRIIHEVKGSGQGLFSVDRGLMLSKSGQVTITLTTRMLITKRKDDGSVADHNWEETVERHVTNFRCRTLGDREPDPRPASR